MKPSSARMTNRWDERPDAVTKFWLPGSLILFVALVAYCEVCTVLAGEAPPGVAVSGSWALQVSIGWAIVGAFLGSFGASITANTFVRQWPVLSAVLGVLAIAAFTLLCELPIAQLRGWSPDLVALIGVRGPVNLLASTALVGIFAARRRGKVACTPESLEVMTGTGYVTVATDEIESLQADGNYLNIAHVSGRKYLLRSTMTAAERLLGSREFVRIHRSTIVNRSMIRERRRSGMLVLRSGRTVRIGRAFRDRLE
jgi:hypothetical protein